MASDLKYGRVTTERGTIGEDELVFLFRAQDETLPMLLSFYHMFCVEVGSSREHLNSILDARERIVTWQMGNHTQVPS